MQRAPTFASKMSPGSLSGFPEDLIIKSARIVLSSEIDMPGRRPGQRGKSAGRSFWGEQSREQLCSDPDPDGQEGLPKATLCRNGTC